ncbi:Condensin-2 complex subunit D3 [Nymphon striatum]|nr:Condensin-2 complex subunit D3 [Nymphon striatum]
MARRLTVELKTETISTFLKFRTTELNDEWVKNVWNCHFTDLDEDAEEVISDFDEFEWEKLINDACNICRMWSDKRQQKDVQGNEHAREEDEGENSGFWLILVENDIKFKNLLALIAFLICRGQNNTSSCKDRLISLFASTLYVNILCIPGSSAFKLFNSMLFQTAIKSLKIPQKIASRTRKRAHQDKNNMKGNKKPKKRNQPQQAREPVENIEIDENENLFKETSDFEALTHEEIENIVVGLNNFMNELIYCLKNFSMRECQQTIEHLIQHLAGLTELELCVDIPSSLIISQRHCIENLVPLAYKALSVICDSFHGDLLFIAKTIMKVLLPNLLMTGGSSGVVMSNAIPRSVIVMKDRTVSFIFSVIERADNCGQEALKILIQHICTKVTDKSEYRTKVAQVVATLLTVLKPQMYEKLGRWLQKYVHNSKVAYRMFGLELMGYMLNNKSGDNQENSHDSQHLSKEALLCTMLQRCSDKSASVRAKALTMLAMCSLSTEPSLRKAMMKIFSTALQPDETIVNTTKQRQSSAINITGYFIYEEKNKSHFLFSDNEDETVFQLQSINFPKSSVSYPDAKETLVMLRKRTEDEKVAVRKAAIQVMENIICLDVNNLEEINIEILKDHCMDPALLVRKQALQSITALLLLYPTNYILQKHWIDGVLPLVFDKETSVQQKCYELLEELLLNPICGSKKTECSELLETAWKILGMISTSHNQDNQRYLQKACQEWAKNGRINTQIISAIKKEISAQNDAAVWFLLSSFASNIDIKDPCFIVQHWRKCCESNKSEEGLTVQRLIQVIGAVTSRIKHDDKIAIIDDLKQQLSSFSSPPELIAVMLSSFTKLCKSLKEKEDNSDDLSHQFFTELLKASDVFLSKIILQSNIIEEDEELIVRHLFTLGEVAQFCPERIPRRVSLLIQSLITTPCITGPAPEKYGLPLSQMSQPSQQPFSQLHGSLFKPRIRAHAFITLGKLCLQNEDIAKKSVAAMARELAETADTTIRNNIVVILSDLCVRYTILVDPYMPNVTACLKDPSELVRRQTLILLIKLLQEDYIKWKGIMFYQLLTVLVDENLQMRNFAEYCFIALLLPKQPLMMYHHFVEAIFHFNGYKDHESYNKFKISDKEAQLFNMSGSENQQKRLLLYRFMLESMSDEHKFFLTQKICQDILNAVSDSTLLLNEKGQAILHDAFSILYSDEIKLSSLKVSTQEQVDDADMAAVLVATAKKTLITQVVKKNVIENIVPIVIALKHKLEQQKSSLLRELMLYLKELMKDYRHEVKDIMSADKQLAKEIEYDLQRFEKEQEAEKNGHGQNEDTERRKSIDQSEFTTCLEEESVHMSI